MWPDSNLTQDLLDQAKAGNADALDQLLAKHREPIRRMIDLRLDPAIAQRLDASDVVQEVLIEASLRLQAYLKRRTCPFTCGCAISPRTTSSTPIAGITSPRSAASIANSRCIAPPWAIIHRWNWRRSCWIRI